MPDVDVADRPGPAGRARGGVPHRVRDVIKLPAAGYKFGQLDHTKDKPSVTGFLDLCSKLHLFPLQIFSYWFQPLQACGT